MLFQPDIQRCQIREVRHLLPQPRSRILDVLLDLPLLPARGGIAELGRKNVVVRHCQEADVDLSLLAAANAIDRCLHVIVNAATRSGTPPNTRKPCQWASKSISCVCSR